MSSENKKTNTTGRRDQKPSKTQMRRRARKTVAAALLVSSVLVASIPVPKASAEVTTTIAEYTNVDYENLNHITATSLTESLADPDGVEFPMIEEDSNHYATDTVYFSEDGVYNFIYKNPTTKINIPYAIIVGYNSPSLVGGVLDVPSSFNGYKIYNTSKGSGMAANVAVTQAGQPMFYRSVTKHKYEARYENGTLVSNTPSEEYSDKVEISSMKDTYTAVESSSTVEEKDEDGNVVKTIKTDTSVYYTYQYLPCYADEETRSVWDISNVCLYTFTYSGDNSDGILKDTSNTEMPDDTKVFLPNAQTYTMIDGLYHNASTYMQDYGSNIYYNQSTQRMVNATVMYIASQYVTYDKTQNKWLVKTSGPDGSTYSGIFSGKRDIQYLNIPETIQGVGKYAFYSCGIQTVTFNNAISVIGESAFERCTGLTSVGITANSNIQYIEKNCFKRCSSLTSITIPSGCTGICDSAFWGCSSLTNVDFKSADVLDRIGNDVFYGCSRLTSVDFRPWTKDSLTNELVPKDDCPLSSVGCHLFTKCENLEEVIFPKNLHNDTTQASGDSYGVLPISIFQGCDSLKHVVVLNTNFSFVNDGYKLKALLDTDPEKQSFYDAKYDDYLSDSSVKDNKYVFLMPHFMQMVEDNGFYFEGYKDSQIHDLTKTNEISFKYIDKNMNGLYEKVVKSVKVTHVSQTQDPTDEDLYQVVETLDTDNPVDTVFQVDSTGALYNVSLLHPSDLATGQYYHIEIPAAIGPYNITQIGSNFQGNEQVSQVIIPGTVTGIADGAFKGCYHLNRVHFENPDAITSLGNEAFKTQNSTTNNDSPQPSGEPTALTFEGPITNTSLPFQYAMNADNKINNSNQTSACYIDCFTGFPDNMHVMYNKDQDKAMLVKAPVFYPVENPDPVPDPAPYPYAPFESNMLSNSQNRSYEYVNEIRKALIKEKKLSESDDTDTCIKYIAAAYKAYTSNSSVVDPGDSTKMWKPSEDVINTIASVYTMEIPSGVQVIKPYLFSKAGNIGYDPDGSGPAGGPAVAVTADMYQYTNDPANTSINASNIPTISVAFDHVNDKGDETGDESLYKNCVVESITMNTIENIDDYAFFGLPNLKTVVMYNSDAGSENIGNYAFAYCDSLESITLPKSTASMGNRPFAGDRMLTDVKFSAGGSSNSANASGDNFTYADGVIYGTESGAKSSVVECLETRYNKTAGQNGVGGATVSANELAGVKTIQDEAFMNTNVLTVDLSKSKIDIVPEFCFAYQKVYGDTTSDYAGGSKLATVVLPSTCSTIMQHAFYNTGLANITMPSSVVIIDSNAFDNDDTKVDTYVSVSTTEGSVPYKLAIANGPQYFWTIGDPVKEQFTVKFYDGFEEANTLVDTQYVVTGEDADTAAAEAKLPTHDGYVFNKWTPSPTGVAEHMSTYAQWIPAATQTFTVTFYDWDLTVIKERTVAYGEDAEEPKSPSRTGYTFTGWTKGFTNVTEDIQTMAVYTPNGSTPDSGSSGSSGTSSTGSDSSGSSSTSTGSTGTSSTSSSSSGSSSSGSSASSSSSSGSSGSSSSGSGGSNNGADFTTYTLTVINGSGSGSYVAGTTVLISAYTPSTGYTFDKWTSTVETTAFTNAEAYTTTLTMPASSTTVTANYLTSEGKSTSDKKSNSGASGSGTSNNSGSGSGTVSGNDNGSTTKPNSGSGNGNSGTTVDVSKDGISDKDVASATVNGSTDDFTVKIREDADATLAVATALKNRYGSLDDIRYVAMDISLYDESGTKKITDTSGLAVTVTIPIPDELRKYAGNNKVAAVVGNYELDQLTPTFSTINGVPTVTFTATHFSPYTVYVNLQSLSDGTISDNTPKTGDMLHPKWFLAIGLALASAVLFLKKDKKVTVKTA